MLFQIRVTELGRSRQQSKHLPNSQARYDAAELCYVSVRLRVDVKVSDVDEAVYLSLERLQLSDANHICARPSLQVLHDLSSAVLRSSRSLGRAMSSGAVLALTVWLRGMYW